jgi:hypothetical protein
MAQTAYRECFRKSKRRGPLWYILFVRNAPHSSYFRDSRAAGNTAISPCGNAVLRAGGLPDLRLGLTRKTDELPVPDAA